MNKFDKWFQGINEELNSVEMADSTVAPESDRNDMIGDIDNIMTSLETLASELTEELSIELEVNEGAGDMVMSFINGMKASKAQAKVNKIKMNAADLEFAADKFDGDKKKSIQDKSKKVGQQAKDLQKMVDDRFSGKGNYVDSKLHKAKIEGQIQIIKRTSGMEDNPNKKADMKTKMSELTNKYKEESKALKELEDGEKEALAKAKEDQSVAPATKAPADAPDAPADEAPADTRTDKQKQDDATKEAAAEKEARKNADGADDATKADREKKNSKDGLIDRYKVLLKKAQDSGDKTKAKDIQSKIDKISQKESWQLEGTELGRLFEMELIRYENSFILNESKYSVNSIKYKFNTLLNS